MRSTMTTSSALPRTASGSVSRTRTPVSSGTWSLRLSRCWTLTSRRRRSRPPARPRRPRSAWRARAGRVGVRQLVDERHLGRAREQRGQVHLLELRVAVGHPAARDHLEPLGLRGGLRGGGGARGSRSRRRGPPPRWPGPPGACGRSCPRPRPCPGRPCGGRGRPTHAHAPRRLWTSRSSELDAHEGRDQAAQPVDRACCGAAARRRPRGGSARRAGPAARAAG